MTEKTMLEVALGEIGIKEIRGDGSNPEVEKYHESIGKEEWEDDISWCSSAMNWCAIQSGMEHSGKATAISWLKIGEEIESLAECQLGDIIVFHRGDVKSWKGHVAMYINKLESKNFVYVLGGNQRDEFCIRPYRIDKIRPHGIRRLRKVATCPPGH